MKCNLIVGSNEVTVRDYTMVEDNGLIGLTHIRAGITFEYEDDEERAGKHMLVIRGSSLDALLRFLSFIELPVNIIY